MKRDDPLNEILLPAYDLAVRIRDGERRSRSSECLLSGAFLVLLAERDAMWTLIRNHEQKRARDREYTEALEEEAGAAAVDRARSYLRLHNRTGVVA